MLTDPFQLTAAVLAVAAVVGFVATRLRQPLIVAFIAVGIVVGPAVLGWVDGDEPLELFAEIGIAILLFLVGLKLDVNLVRTTGLVALLTGLGQVAFTSGVGLVIALALGFDLTDASYIAVALTFSSTIIIVKLLSDKGELDELHGRIALGFLIVQDIVVVVVLIVLSVVGGGTGESLAAEISLLLAKAAGFLGGLLLVTRYLLRQLLHHAARSQELLIVSAVAWAVALAALSEGLGFSTEVGAFLAGFAIASTPFRDAVGSSLTPLRDFLLLFFFIDLGARLDFAAIGENVPAAVLLSLFVLIGNPLIVLVIMGTLGFRKRVGFLAGLTVAQISEFSLIFVNLGLDLGHLDEDTVGLVTLVGLITIGLSTYLILYSHTIYERLEPVLSVFERRNPTKGDNAEPPPPVDVIVYGHGRFGGTLVDRLTEVGVHVLVVEWDPTTTREGSGSSPVDTVYGDAEDPEFPAALPLGRAEAVVSTIARVDTNRILVDALRRRGFDKLVAVTAHTRADAERLAGTGADLVLQPFEDAGHANAERILAVIREATGAERDDNGDPDTGWPPVTTTRWDAHWRR